MPARKWSSRAATFEGSSAYSAGVFRTAPLERRTARTEIGTDSAAKRAKVKNRHEIAAIVPPGSRAGFPKPPRLAIIPARAEANDCAIIWLVEMKALDTS